MRISGITYIPRKTHKVRNISMLAGVLILLSILAVMAISLISAWKLVHPKKEALTAFSSNIVPEFKEVNFSDIDKEINLKGWLFPTKGSTKTVILAHGYGENRFQFHEKTLDIVKVLQSKGYSILLFDFRNSGLSGGNTTTIGINEKKDLAGAVKFVKSQGSKKIALLGYSMGAATSILAASESNDVDAVIADSPYSDLGTYLNASLPLWSKLPAFPFNKTILFSAKVLNGIDPSKASPKEVISKLAPRPVLLIHSRDDKTIPVANSRDLYNIYFKAAPGKAEYWESEGADHVGTYEKNPEEYMQRIVQFLDKSLTDKPAK